MKKVLVILLITPLVAIFLFAVTCSMFFYDGEETEDGSMFIGYSKRRKKAFVGMLSGDLENTEFILPDEFMGCPVTTLGGEIGRGFPCPFNFYIELPEEYREYVLAQRVFGTTDSVFDEVGDGWETVVFRITLGRKIREIKDAQPCSYIGIDIADGENRIGDILYKIVPYFLVPEDNGTFYAEGGRLFYKNSGEPAGEFEYE